MPATNELILFVPGLGAKERDEYITKLTDGLHNYCTANGIKHTVEENSQTNGSAARRLHLEEQNRTIHIQEVFWADMAPALSSESLPVKIIRGCSLLFYWVFSYRLFKVIKDSKYMLFSMMFSIFVVLFWYYGAITTALQAVVSSDTLFGIQLPSVVTAGLAYIESRFSGWNAWVVASLPMAVVPVRRILDISYFTKAYLQNRESLRHRVRGRVAQAVHGIRNDPVKYDRVTVVAHSFGVVAGTEYLAEYEAQAGEKIEFITLGGPLLVVSAKSRRIREAMDKLVTNPCVQSWTDYFSKQDWLCTYSPVKDAGGTYQSHPITSTVSFDKKLNGASHNLYFQDWDVLGAIINNKVGAVT
jgi:hypothetical protein